MKLLDTLKGWEHTFTAWVAKDYQAFRKEEPSLVAMGDRVYPYVKSALSIALSFEPAAVGQIALPLLDSIHAKLDTAAGLLYDFGPHPDVTSALETAQSELGSFEQTAGIKSTGAKDAIAKALASLQGFVAAVQGAQAAAAAAPPVA